MNLGRLLQFYNYDKLWNEISLLRNWGMCRGQRVLSKSCRCLELSIATEPVRSSWSTWTRKSCALWEQVNADGRRGANQRHTYRVQCKAGLGEGALRGIIQTHCARPPLLPQHLAPRGQQALLPLQLSLRRSPSGQYSWTAGLTEGRAGSPRSRWVWTVLSKPWLCIRVPIHLTKALGVFSSDGAFVAIARMWLKQHSLDGPYCRVIQKNTDADWHACSSRLLIFSYQPVYGTNIFPRKVLS